MGNQAISQGIGRHYRKVIRVIPVLDTSEYASGDVLFVSTEIPNAVLSKGGCSMLKSVSFVLKQDASPYVDLHFSQISKDLGTINGVANISTANLTAMKYLGSVEFLAANWNDIGSYRVATHRQSETKNGLPIYLQAEPGSTSVYFGGMTATVDTYAVDDLEIIFNIEY